MSPGYLSIYVVDSYPAFISLYPSFPSIFHHFSSSFLTLPPTHFISTVSSCFLFSTLFSSFVPSSPFFSSLLFSSLFYSSLLFSSLLFSSHLFSTPLFSSCRFHFILCSALLSLSCSSPHFISVSSHLISSHLLPPYPSLLSFHIPFSPSSNSLFPSPPLPPYSSSSSLALPGQRYPTRPLLFFYCQ